MILKFIVDHLIKMKWADGYKMYGVGAAMFFSGLAGLAHGFAAGAFQGDSFDNCIKLVLGGVGVIGAAGKADGLIAATHANTAAVQATTAATENVAQEVASK